MKKEFLSILLCGAMLASFTACENGNEPNNGSGNGNGNQTEEPDFNPNGHEYVDLGLPSGTLWATCNIGANSPEEYGDYFAWGETETKSYYERDNYKWGVYNDDDSGDCGMTQYNKTDGKTTLDVADDAASVNWGGSWRMPTRQQLQELILECTWTQKSGGYEVEGTNGNMIFIPFAGFLMGSANDNDVAGEGCFYWSSSVNTNLVRSACSLYVSTPEFLRIDEIYLRSFGLPVRAVCSPK